MFLTSNATSQASRTTEWPFPTMCCTDREVTRAGGQVARRPGGLSWQQNVQLNCNCFPRCDVNTEVASDRAGGSVQRSRSNVDGVEQGGVYGVRSAGSHESCGASGARRSWRSLIVMVVGRVG